MKTGKETWKQYVKEAKSRLTYLPRGDENDEEAYCLLSRRLTESEVQKMTKIIEEIAASETFVVNPLGMLMDDGVYELGEGKRNRYIFDLSAIYLRLKEKIQA